MRILMIALLTMAATPTVAQTTAEAPKSGQVLFAANNARVGVIDRVLADGSVRVIIGEKLVTIPGATISFVQGKPTTSLTKTEVRKLD
ncbi:MAG: hypothetical protein ACOYLS_02140 [Polymorphobacter sp.]|jgi:hypothetical protein